MDSQRDDGSVNPTAPRPPETTRTVTDYRTEVGHYRRPLFGIPWIAGLILVPALLAGIGLATTRPGGTAVPGTQTPSVAASNANPSTAPSPTASFTPNATGSVLEITADAQTVYLTGAVKDAATQTAMVEAVKKAYGSGFTVVNRLTTDAKAPAVDATAFEGLAAALHGVNGLNFFAQGGQVSIGGVVPTEDAKTALLAAIGKVYPGAPVNTDGLAVGDPTRLPASCDEASAYVRLITSQTKIQFITGSSNLTTVSTKALERIAEAVKACTSVKLVVSGNTDNKGNATANQTLSEKRAESVKTALVKLGVTDANITTVGNGDTKPIASNDTASGRATNRRVDIAVA